MNNIKYKCISVASMTYAQKANDLLKRNGIDSYIVKQTIKNEYPDTEVSQRATQIMTGQEE